MSMQYWQKQEMYKKLVENTNLSWHRLYEEECEKNEKLSSELKQTKEDFKAYRETRDKSKYADDLLINFFNK
jgi:DNA-binding protein H-NS